jgi:DNA repair exonuclease SbcCD ATPase subunit
MITHTGTPSPPTDARRFELQRFAWGAPDRLELAGTFTGLDGSPSDLPVLVLTGADRTHRLPAAPDDVSGAPENGRPWHAAFVWQEAPAAFQAAVLQLGGELAVDLPEPGADDAEPGIVELPIRLRPGGDRLRLEAELLGAGEELREAQAALRRTEEELARARADLDTEREGRAADAVRFRQGLAQVRESAEEALAAEQRTAERLHDELAAGSGALAAKDAELAEMRGELEVAATFRTEIDTLQKRLEDAQGRIDTARAILNG